MLLTFKEYIKAAKEQLYCNASEEYRSKYVTYDYSEDDIDSNLDYFREMRDKGISPYKALLMFSYTKKT